MMLSKTNTFRTLQYCGMRFPRLQMSLTKPQINQMPDEYRSHVQFDPNAYFPNPNLLNLKEGREKIVGSWLLLCAGGVFFMVVLGGYTRLTHSGLSMTKWRPIEYSYPSSDEEWEKEFQHYKQFPEYLHSRNEITLEKFKKIYAVEYIHRVSGSTLGALYVLPLLIFHRLGWVTRKYAKRLYAIGGIGLLQGLIGWWMVKSGLEPKPSYQQKPRVSPYRLTVHLSMAAGLYSLLLMNAISCFRKPQAKIVTPENYQSMKTIYRLALLLVHCVAINLLSGAAMAGIDAGKVYNTWPLMNDQVIPEGMTTIQPIYRNWFENYTRFQKLLFIIFFSVQFNHRTAAYITYGVAMTIAYKATKLNLPKITKFAAFTVFALCNYQLYSGIIALLNQVQVHSGSVHQFNAMNVLTATLFLLHVSRKPQKGYKRYIKQFIK